MLKKVSSVGFFLVASVSLQAAERKSISDYQVESQYGLEQPVLSPHYSKEDRLELNVGGTYSPFSSILQTSSLSGGLTYHFTERHSWEPLWASFQNSKLTKFSKNDVAGKSSVSRTKLSVDLPERMFSSSYYYAPYYGKIHITDGSVVHFDVFFGGGPLVVQTRETFSDSSKAANINNRIGGVIAVGSRIFIASRFALKIEIKDFIYPQRSFGSPVIESGLATAVSLSTFLF